MIDTAQDALTSTPLRPHKALKTASISAYLSSHGTIVQSHTDNALKARCAGKTGKRHAQDKGLCGIHSSAPIREALSCMVVYIRKVMRRMFFCPGSAARGRGGGNEAGYSSIYPVNLKNLPTLASLPFISKA